MTEFEITVTKDGQPVRWSDAVEAVLAGEEPSAFCVEMVELADDHGE